MLYPGSGKPLFSQLKDILLQKISSGEYQEGTQLPSERQLAETYGISRMTARQALTELVQAGKLYRQQGKGYFVASRQIENKLDRMFGLVEELVGQNMNCTVELMEKGYVTPPIKAREALRIENDSQVFRLVRRVMVDGAPLSIDYTYLPMNVAYLVEPLDLNKVVIYNYLEKSGYKLVNADQMISAGVLTPPEAHQLARPRGFPVLIIDRTAFVEGRLPLVYSHTLYLSDRYHYTLTLNR
jgi:GntR family transcriptional regulator